MRVVFCYISQIIKKSYYSALTTSYSKNKKNIKIPKEFILEVHYGENFKTLCNIMIVEEVISLEKIKEFVEILTGGLLKVSEGSLVNWMHQKSKQCKNILKKLKIGLKNMEILHTDLTETKVNGKISFVRNYSTEKVLTFKKRLL